MTFPFLHLDAHGAVLRRIAAGSLSDARERLCPAPGEPVVSQASHAIGLPKALAAGRCTSCGQRPRLASVARCELCQQTHRTAVEAASKARTGANYASRVRKPKAAPSNRFGKGSTHTDEARERMREAKARHDRQPDRRAKKTAWQRAARLARGA